jgi:Family of unknown function (DUF5701)
MFGGHHHVALNLKGDNVLHQLPDLDTQVENLLEVGVHALAGLTAAQLRAAATNLGNKAGVLAVHPDHAPASALAPLLSVSGKPGFVVSDMTDVDRFTSIKGVNVPPAPVYLVADPQRGDEMANWSPDEALPAIVKAGRTPMTLTEGIHWVLQCPEVLERNHCFMTIGSRLGKSNGTLDSRTPALWLSNGTGRDGPGNRNAAKVGWCWAGNRHTWLGFASAATRHATGGPSRS